MIQKTCKKN